MRILISAYACEPGKGSEPGVGWTWVHEIAKLHEVWVVTRSNNRQPIEAASVTGSVPNIHWVYYDLPAWSRFWKRGGAGLHVYYFFWQLGLYFVVGKLCRKVKLDCIHQVTFGTYWTPSFLPLHSIPFIWGPVGGAESSPPEFRALFGWRNRAYEMFRDAVRLLGNLNPLVRLNARRAKVVLTKTHDTRRQLEALGARHVSVVSEVALPDDEIEHLAAQSGAKQNVFHLCSLGRLIHWKGFELSIRAFARLRDRCPDSKYWIIGDGPERARLERLAETLNLQDSVVFFGGLRREPGLEKLKQCHVLVHPSLHDSGGWACVEAMASGVPVICLNLGGPATQVTAESGIKIHAGTPEQVIRDLGDAMIKLAEDDAFRHSLCIGALRHVRESFSWEAKRKWLSYLYSHEYGQNKSKNPSERKEFASMNLEPDL